MSFAEGVSRVSSLDIIIESADLPSGAGFNLADELAMAEEEGLEGHDTGRLSPTKSAVSGRSDYDGSEYGDIDDDSDGYLDGRIDMDELELQGLVQEVSGGKDGVINKFVQDLRGMRGQMDVENNARRYVTSPRQRHSRLESFEVWLMEQINYDAKIVSISIRPPPTSSSRHSHPFTAPPTGRYFCDSPH